MIYPAINAPIIETITIQYLINIWATSAITKPTIILNTLSIVSFELLSRICNFLHIDLVKINAMPPAMESISKSSHQGMPKSVLSRMNRNSANLKTTGTIQSKKYNTKTNNTTDNNFFIFNQATTFSYTFLSYSIFTNLRIKYIVCASTFNFHS